MDDALLFIIVFIAVVVGLLGWFTGYYIGWCACEREHKEKGQ